MTDYKFNGTITIKVADIGRVAATKEQYVEQVVESCKETCPACGSDVHGVDLDPDTELSNITMEA